MNESSVPTPERMADWEACAEAAYAAMYDARDYNQKDLRDDTLLYLNHALKVAEALGLAADAERLRARSANIMGVYNSQFRYIGR